MAGWADWLLARRATRVALIAALFPLPLPSVISAAIVVMITNAHGWKVAVQECAVATAVLVAVTVLAGGYWAEVGVGAAVTWMAAIGVGELRRRASLTLAVQCALLVGLVGALAFTIVSDDPQAYWERVLHDWTERARLAGLDVGPADLIPGAAQLMTGVMAASAVASAMAALFLGSWWAQRTAGRSFGVEFQELRMGRILGVVAGLTGLLFLTAIRATADDLLLVLAVGFVVQGLAVIHWHGARRGWPRGWSTALYLPLALLPKLAAFEMLLLALLGLIDNAFGLRRIGDKVV